MANPNFLILDEPTNDLDIITLNILEEYLLSFPGCIIIISHDRYFMDRIVDHLFIMKGNGDVKDFPGNYTDYRLEYKEETSKIDTEATEVKNENKAKQKANYEQRKKYNRLLKDIEKLEDQKAEILEQFNDTSLPMDQINELSSKLESINETLEEKEMEWMELAETIDL